MYRISNLALFNARLLLHRCQSPVELQVATVSRLPPLCKKYSPLERAPCPPPPPPLPPPPKDDRLLWGTLAFLVVTGGFAVFAKDDPEVRDWLSMNAPWFDDFIAIMFQENMTYKEFALKCIKDIKRYGREPEKQAPRECSLEGKPIPIVKSESGPEDGKICEIIPPPGTVDVCEMQRCFKDYTETIVHNYMTARDACDFYNKEVEDTMEKFSLSKMKALHKVKEERIELVTTSLANIKETKEKFDQLVYFFDCSIKSPKDMVENTNTLLQDCRDKIKIVDAEYQWKQDKSTALDSLWEMVEEFVLNYVYEIGTVIPGVNFKSKSPAGKMTGDPDLMLYHTYRYLKDLEEKVDEGNAAIASRVQRGIEAMTPLPEKQAKARENSIEYAINAGRKQMDREFAQRLRDQQACNYNIAKEALKKQAEKLEETLKIKLVQKEKEATEKLNKMVAEKVAAELKLFAIQLGEMRRKLSLVEWKLAERLKAERETRRSKELYNAGAALLAATRKGDPIVKVDRELKAIEKASGHEDKLMQTILKAVPKSVRENGIVPEAVLRERYKQMETVAMRVALVEADGAPMPVYLLSYVQSLFLFMKLSGIPRAEIEKPPQEPPKDLDTFDKLQRARYWVETGNLAIALRYVNALEGASRAAAAWWYEAARDHLETKQIAEAVVAHASAMGLQYV